MIIMITIMLSVIMPSSDAGSDASNEEAYWSSFDHHDHHDDHQHYPQDPHDHRVINDHALIRCWWQRPKWENVLAWFISLGWSLPWSTTVRWSQMSWIFSYLYFSCICIWPRLIILAWGSHTSCFHMILHHTTIGYLLDDITFNDGFRAILQHKKHWRRHLCQVKGCF